MSADYYHIGQTVIPFIPDYLNDNIVRMLITKDDSKMILISRDKFGLHDLHDEQNYFWFLKNLSDEDRTFLKLLGIELYKETRASFKDCMEKCMANGTSIMPAYLYSGNVL